MITSAPIPSWSSILSGFFSPVKKRDFLRPWMLQANSAYFARSAFALASFASPGDNVWIPEYFCNQSLIPLRNKGVNIVFYPINEYFYPDWKKCDTIYTEGNNIFVLVHYFGIQNDISGALDFCFKGNMIFVEDAAHILIPNHNIGKFSDYTFYSPHKLIGIPDGSILVSNHNINNNLGFISKIDWNWLVKRVTQKIIPEKLWQILKPLPPGDFFTDSEGETPHVQEMSRFAQKMLAFNVEHLKEEMANRLRRNWEWRNNLQNWPGIHPIGSSGIPYRAVFRCDDEIIADTYFKQLRKLKIPVESWPDLPPEIKKNPDSMAVRLRKTQLFLPITAEIPPIPPLP